MATGKLQQAVKNAQEEADAIFRRALQLCQRSDDPLGPLIGSLSINLKEDLAYIIGSLKAHKLI